LEAVRQAVGPDFVVGLRMSVDEGVAQGLHEDEGIEVARAISATGLIDFIDVVFGAGFSDRELADIIPPFGRPAGQHIELAGRVRSRVDIPVLHAGRIPDLATARHALASGSVDMVGMTRAHIADPHVVLSHRNERIGGRPGVAAGASSFLVAWGQGASAVATTVTEIRAVRATRADGRLDPDGGLLLATSSTVITGGPVVAFDGTRWLVVWAEESGSTHDLRAVAVESDGTVVDASPRLVASDVVAGEPAVASTGDGRVLVVYARPHDATRDVVATLVTP